MIERVVSWFNSRKGRVGYSMARRNGPSSYDCSSSLYFSLIEAGILPAGTRIGNTDSLFGDLERNGFVALPWINGEIQAKRGDVFIWGKRGASGGASGHTGVFVDSQNIIHCAYGYNGIHIDNHDWLWVYNGSPALTIYRYVGKKQVRKVKFEKPFRAEEFANVNNIHQAKLAGIVASNFDWTDNGIPSKWLVRADEFDGEVYRINGEFEVLEELVENGAKYIKLNAGEFGEVWVWERALNNPENFALKSVKVEVKPAEKIETVEIQAEKPEIVEKTDTETRVEVQKEEKNDMSQNVENVRIEDENEKVVKIPLNSRKLTESEVKMIEEFQNNNLAKIGNSEYTPMISNKAKDKVYFISDIGISICGMLAVILAVFLPEKIQAILAISGAVSAFLANLKVIYKLGSKK